MTLQFKMRLSNGNLCVGVCTGRTAVANFNIGPVKKSMQFVMRRKMLI